MTKFRITKLEERIAPGRCGCDCKGGSGKSHKSHHSNNGCNRSHKSHHSGKCS